MKIAIISGSHRPSSESGRIAQYLKTRITELNADAEAVVVDLGQNPLPLWDESMWGKEGKAAPAWKPISEQLKTCDATIVIAAEWNGTAPAALKNFFHYAGGKELGHKPGLLVGVSGSVNGSYPISEMRASSYKNCKICYMPDHLIVRHAGEILHESPRDGYAEQDTYMRERMDYTLAVLFEYTKAFKLIRQSDTIQNMPQKYAFGQ
ncbi:MAG: NAD(P)H-dependent FMN reductase [Alphaproteobacteria bacterium]|jgi:NAD(P)H-dependent FMN reductase